MGQAAAELSVHIPADVDAAGGRISHLPPLESVAAVCHRRPRPGNYPAVGRDAESGKEAVETVAFANRLWYNTCKVE